MVMYSYELIKGESQLVLGTATLYVAFKIIEQVTTHLDFENKVK